MTPRQVRESCRETERELLGLKSLDALPGRFLEARRALFALAHATAEELKGCTALRESCRSLAITAADPVELAPAPRTRDTAPPPRPR
jgi:hypothetical protein